MEHTSSAFHKDPVWWGICCVVLALHIGGWWLVIKQTVSHTIVSRQIIERIHMNTLSYPTNIQETPQLRKEPTISQEPVVLVEQPPPAKYPLPPPKPAPTPKKQNPTPAKKPRSKAPDSKKTAPSPTTPPKKSKNASPPPPDPVKQKKIAAEQALLAAAEATLSQLEAVATQESALSKNVLSSVPQTMGDLKSQLLSTDSSVSYIDQIAWKLKKTLRFPEYGSVRVEITLGKEGRVEHLSVLASENSKNRAYVEATLPTLSFPSNPNKTAITYTFLLNNE